MYKCNKRIERKNTDIERILVTADSPIFLEEANKLDYVYVVPGGVVHIDQARGKKGVSLIKNYLDFLLIAKAIKSYYFVYGRMFAATRFASTAALTGGKVIERL